MSDRRSLLRGLITLPLIGSVALPSAQAAADPDPTFALIERHQAAQAAFLETFNLADENGQTTPEADAVKEAASDAEQEARYDMHEVVPTTLAGLAAYVAYWHRLTSVNSFELESIGWEAIPTIAEALGALVPAGGAS